MTREDIPVAVKRAVGLHSDDSSICLVDRALSGQARRHEAGAAKCLLHGADSLPQRSATHSSNCIKSESEPLLDADRGSRSDADCHQIA
jgi:hypothetical protein